MTRVSLFRSFLIFASKRNEAKRILFLFIFACFCETKNIFFRFVSHLFASIFFAISLELFRFVKIILLNIFKKTNVEEPEPHVAASFSWSRSRNEMRLRLRRLKLDAKHGEFLKEKKKKLY
jgi:hypothetical protein